MSKLGLTIADVPHVPDALAQFLKDEYPAICWDPSKQDERQHLRYGGIHTLADFLVQANAYQKHHATDGLEPDAERAT